MSSGPPMPDVPMSDNLLRISEKNNVLKSMYVVVRYIDIVGKELLDKAEAEKNILDM